MRQRLSKLISIAGLAASLLWAAENAQAQIRQVTLPAGTVLELKTENGLSSDTSNVGDTFNATISRSVWMDDAIAITEGNTVQGRVTSVERAGRRDPGVLGVTFDKMTIDGRTYVIDGALTSLRADERKQIIDEESRIQGGSSSKRNVMFIGGGAGVGAVIGALAGGGKGAGIGALGGGALGALGAFLAPGSEAKVPAGSDIAMELTRPVTIATNRNSRIRGNNDRMVYSSASMVRSAQAVLRQRNYYEGPSNGVLDDATRRAVAHFQIDNRQPATGNLDQETLASLGLFVGGGGAPAVDTRQIATEISRKASTLLSLCESAVGVRIGNVRTGSRPTEADLDLLLDVNSFVTAANWYEQASRPGNQPVSVGAVERILLREARDVDAGIDRMSTNVRIRDTWRSIQDDLRSIRLNGAVTSN